MATDKGFMYKVAKLYYEDKLTQESIARRVQVSKYKICRTLKDARGEGMVKIQVVKPIYINNEIMIQK